MNNTIKEVLSFVEENDVKFIRLSFCDPFGYHKNISIMANELKYAFENGVAFDSFAVKGFSDVTTSDLLLFPDPTTLTVLPWRPGPGIVVRFYCNIKNPDKTPFVGDSRLILKSAINRLERLGYQCKLGVECEFYLFKTDEQGNPTKIPMDTAGYLDIAPLDKGENIRREICLCLEEMSLTPESSRHEIGPGQNEIDFNFSDPLTSADNLLTFKSVVKSIAERNGLHASFMPKPLARESGNGLHINMSLYQNGVNLFSDGVYDRCKAAQSFIQGILNRISEITLFLNPISNSYERLGSFEAPKYVSWSYQNRSQLIRMPIAPDNKTRMELRSPDPTINPYIAFGLILHAGIDGIENQLELVEPINENLYNANAEITKNLKHLPENLNAAILAAEQSEFIKSIIDKNFLLKYFDSKKLEAQSCEQATNQECLYNEKYFNVL